MIVITGGAGFIGSNLINYLVQRNKNKIVSVDWHNKKNQNYFSDTNFETIEPNSILSFLKKNINKISVVVHLGAITSTTEQNLDLIVKNNLDLSINLWKWCKSNRKRFIYASSAATYGNGNNGFNDDHNDQNLSKLIPLNLYGWSKQVIDRFIWHRQQKNPLLQCVGLKFFNVYGPNEYHKKEMRSIVLKIFENIKSNKTVQLFKSHNKKYKDGEQLRDFIYVKDVVKVIDWFIENKNVNGLFNVGSGTPQSFKDLSKFVFRNCNKKFLIEYVPTPINIRKQYQYFTKANISKLRKAGYKEKFFNLEDGVSDYVKNYLIKI